MSILILADLVNSVALNFNFDFIFTTTVTKGKKDVHYYSRDSVVFLLRAESPGMNPSSAITSCVLLDRLLILPGPPFHL